MEGQTELLFVRKLLNEIAGEKNIEIEEQHAKKSEEGRRVFTTISEIRAFSRTTSKKYYVLIRDCGSENNVKSDILDSYKSLSRQPYEKILGLRDVYPQKYDDIARLKTGLKFGVTPRSIPVRIMLAVMEVEAWFLAETTHYTEIHPSLTLAFIKSRLHLDLERIDLERRPHPAQDLNNIYHLVGFAYNKSKRNVLRTIKALDFSTIYFVLKERITFLGEFITELDAFLA